MLSAVAEQIGMDYQTAVKVSAGFGGGMYLGSVCGAVTGGIMVIGLKHGGLGPTSMQTAILVRDFADRFKAQHKSINCPDLTGFDLGKIDLRNPETLKKIFGNLSTPRGPESGQRDARGTRSEGTVRSLPELREGRGDDCQ